MSIRYETTIPESGFNDAEYDAVLCFEGNDIDIQAGHSADKRLTLTLEQFEAVAKEVEKYKLMQQITEGT